MLQVFDDSFQRKRVPYKDFGYVEHRFLQHPVYEYRFLGIQNEEGGMKSFMVLREERYDGAKICKIVDFYGPYEEIIDTASMKITMNLWIYIATVFRRNIYLQQVFHGAKRRKQLSQIILLHLNKKIQIFTLRHLCGDS